MHNIIRYKNINKIQSGGILSGLGLENLSLYKALGWDKLKKINTTPAPKQGNTSKAFGMQGINNLNTKYGAAFNGINTLMTGLNDTLVGNEATGDTARNLNAIADAGAQIASQFNPLGGAVNSTGKLIGNVIGGTKDRVEGSGSAAINAISTGLSFAGPVGMVVGGLLNVINGIGGKRVDKLADRTDQISSGYSGTTSTIRDSISKYSNKKAGLFDFGFARKGNKAIKEARRLQDLTTDITEEGKRRKENTAGETYISQNLNKYSGNTPQLILSKNGVKFPELKKARELIRSWSSEFTKNQGYTQKFQIGGTLNLIPSGSLHARRHNLEKIDPELEGQITKKGIPVIARSEGGVTQTAEIEKDEWTLRKEFTDQLESLYSQYQEDPSDDIVIEAGKLVCFELLKNTDDRSGLIKSIK